MQIRYLRDHFQHKAGELSDNNLTVEGLNYLLRVKVVEIVEEEAKLYVEKAEFEPAKEKAENKTANVPTAKKKKK